jgi:uncharacterized damage-inducible protein DinB
MSSPILLPNRRSFLSGAALAAGLYGLNRLAPAVEAAAASAPPEPKQLFVGPLPGYTPAIGTVVSELTYISSAVTGPLKGLTTADLDYLFDPNANTIGALLLHLAATETYYGMNTFENKKWDSWPDDIKAKWDPAMNLGDAGRKTIKGHSLDFYLTTLHDVREHTLAELRKKDDAWLQNGDTEQFGPTKVNIHWKWFHVTEHESHHSGQIAFLQKRLPGAKPASEG